jgi:hypothetical protein
LKTKFFQAPETQKLIANKINELESINNIDTKTFSKERDALIIGALQLFIQHAPIWDERVTFNIENLRNTLIRELASKANESNLNLLFTSCFRFFMENFIFYKDDIFPLTGSIKHFAIYRQDEFDQRSSEQITYALKEMPLSLLREFFTDDNAKSYQDYIKRANGLEDAGKHWDDTLRENLKKSEELNDSLVIQLNKFNFVGLYKGFAELGEKKEKELWWAKLLMFTLGLAIPAPLIIEAFLLADMGTTASGWSSITRLIPILSLTLILVYFFRVALQNFNSVKAQLVQIDLRKSLCQFIQNYANYAKDIREHNTDLLVKFEEVIFSNIMPSEDKIPSTFDGIEQLTNLIGAIKKGN